MSFFDGVGQFFNNVLSPVTSVVGGIANLFGGISANNIATSNLRYQRDFNQQIFDREDTSYQRMVKDLTAAGLNPALALKTPGASSGGTASTPQQSYKRVDYLEPLNALLNVRKMLGDIDQQEATTNNLIGKTENEKALTEGQLSFMRQQGALYGSQKALNDLDIENYGVKLQFDLNRTNSQINQMNAAAEQSKEFAEYYRHRTIGQMAENKWIDPRYEAQIKKINIESKAIAEEARKNSISNRFLAESLRLNLDLSKQQIKKLERENDYAPTLFRQQSMSNTLEILKTMYNLEYAENNSLPYGIAANRKVSGGFLGANASFDTNRPSIFESPERVETVQNNWKNFVSNRLNSVISKQIDFLTGDALTKSVLPQIEKDLKGGD